MPRDQHQSGPPVIKTASVRHGYFQRTTDVWKMKGKCHSHKFGRCSDVIGPTQETAFTFCLMGIPTLHLDHRCHSSQDTMRGEKIRQYSTSTHTHARTHTRPCRQFQTNRCRHYQEASTSFISQCHADWPALQKSCRASPGVHICHGHTPAQQIAGLSKGRYNNSKQDCAQEQASVSRIVLFKVIRR